MLWQLILCTFGYVCLYHCQRHGHYIVKIEYTTHNARFVWRCYTNRPGAPYNSNNKSVWTIKQNSFKPLLECISVCKCHVNQHADCSRQQDQSTGNHVRQTWCVFSAGHSQQCRTIWVCTYSRMKRSRRHSYWDIVKPGRCGCSAWEDITCTRFVVRPVANAAAWVPVWRGHKWTEP